MLPWLSPADQTRYSQHDLPDLSLPIHIEPWLDPSAQGRNWQITNASATQDRLRQLSDPTRWGWPKKPLFFFTDLHADPTAFTASLIASGLMTPFGATNSSLGLTLPSDAFEIVIGGDCFDKGPSNLGVLRLLKTLLDQNLKLTLLAGNHDLRMLLAMRSILESHPASRYLLIRLGRKVIPFFQELLNEYTLSADVLQTLPDEASCQARLLPNATTSDVFKKATQSFMTEQQTARELERLAYRADAFKRYAKDAQLSFRDIYAAIYLWREAFLSPEGEFFWFFEQQQLGYQVGSFLFLHAGCDDEMANFLAEHSCKQLNQTYQMALDGDPLRLYFGALGNMIRTKYRSMDPVLTPLGANALDQAGITALVHGHRNLHHGQRISLRSNVLHFECDTTINHPSRTAESLKGQGAGVTVIHPEGYVLGISSDYPACKHFDLSSLSTFASVLSTRTTTGSS
ncbi:metallophosphoesterase [Nitrincola nitratireducens]|uniref:Calcineurin-like phosphoesterase domain-containing protein n=1 Tax=Nitrincola nitratireducens TaxID=1229521 RepID=W9VGM9_9GAMM|nr:metallophosphoesterase family protein [Nitrincola nitratireducens]EXJ09800.1 hypothetical protein D791_03295 [Nitrincola nitratireducens]